MAFRLIALMVSVGLQVLLLQDRGAISQPSSQQALNSTTTRWNQLSVTWLKWIRLPMTTAQAAQEGWVRNKRCNDRNYFRGNRYTIGNGRSIMLLFDADKKVIGIQGGIPKTQMPRKSSLPWKRERGFYVMTAYFQNPVSACSTNRSKHANQLLIQNGTSADYIEVPVQERGLVGTKWVKGGCVWSMGQFYWYNITPRTACRDLFPVFLLYNNGQLNSFGWAVADNVTSTTYVQAGPSSFKYMIQNDTMPECIKTAGLLSLQHIYLDTHPFFNMC